MNENKNKDVKKPNYRIFHITSENKKIIDDNVCFDNEDSVICYVEKIRNETNIKYYWEPIVYVGVLDENNEKEYEEEMHFSYSDSYLKLNKDDEVNVYKKLINFIMSIPSLYYRILDMIHEIKYAFQRMFFKYDVRVEWDIGYEVLEMIKKNIPKMVKNIHGYPDEYEIKAIELLNKNNDDINNKDKLAINLWKTDLLNFVEKCKLLAYYENMGIQNDNDDDWIDPHKYPIPMKEYSFQPDYNKVGKLYKQTYNEIIDFLKDHLLQMWD